MNKNRQSHLDWYNQPAVKQQALGKNEKESL
jgi:hypothetical protein